MRSTTIPIDLDQQPPVQAPRRRSKWPLAAFAVFAILGALIGHLQRSAPPKLGTVVRATGIDGCEAGADMVVELDVVNQMESTITLTGVAVGVAGAQVLRVAFAPEGEAGPCRPGSSWASTSQRLRLQPNDLGAVFIAYPRVCNPTPGPTFNSFALTIEVGSRKIVRDVTPDADTLTDVNQNASVVCAT
jgi:hypothetical protein